jgi:hypothetical protein
MRAVCHHWTPQQKGPYHIARAVTLGCPVFRAMSQISFFHYKLLSLRYFIIAAQETETLSSITFIHINKEFAKFVCDEDQQTKKERT